MYFSPRTCDTAGSYLSSELQNLLSKQESDLTRSRPVLRVGRLPCGSVVKNPPANAETQVQFLVWRSPHTIAKLMQHNC